MFKALKRWWKYWGAKVNSSFNEHADPKIQLEQAITEAQEQHRRLKEQAANVIANQKQAEMRLNRSMAEYEKLNGNARQAVLMADEATKAGDEKKTARVHPGRRGLRQPAHRRRARDRRDQDHGPAVVAGLRAGQGRGPAERLGPAEEAGRTPETALAARPGEDAGRDEQGDGHAQRDRRRRRAHLRRGPRQDRAALRQGQGRLRAHGRIRRGPHARGRAGQHEHRGQCPPGPDPLRARPGARPRHRATSC